MNFAQEQSGTQRHLIGIGSVVLLHLVIGYFLVTGLGRKVIDVLKKPLEVNIIEEVHKLETPPPPPPKALPTPRRVTEPPPAFVPPPEVHVQAQAAPTISATTATPPQEPVRVAPAPAVVSVGAACPNHLDVRSKIQYPAQALRLGITGEVLVDFTVQPSGAVTDVFVARSSNKVFNAAATNAVAQFRCVGQGQPVRVQVPFAFELSK